MNKISRITKIKIDNQPIDCYTLIDGTIWLGDDIRKFYKANTEDNFIILETVTSSQTKVYEVEDVINNLKPRFLKYLANIGLVQLASISDLTEERHLSKFDLAILKAVKYDLKKERWN